MRLVKLKTNTLANKILYTNKEGWEKIKEVINKMPNHEYFIQGKYKDPRNYTIRIQNGKCTHQLENIYIEVKKFDTLVIFRKGKNEADVCKGVYLGEMPPEYPGDRGSMADMLRDIKVKNPTIDTESGLIYGCECWWGAMEPSLDFLKGCKLNYITVQDFFAERRRNDKNR